MSSRSATVLAALALVWAGCESVESAARERAAKELACPASSLTVRREGQRSDGEQISVSGCDRTMTYACSRTSVRRYGYTCSHLIVPPRPRPTYLVRPIPGTNGTGARVLVVP